MTRRIFLKRELAHIASNPTVSHQKSTTTLGAPYTRLNTMLESNPIVAHTKSQPRLSVPPTIGALLRETKDVTRVRWTTATSTP